MRQTTDFKDFKLSIWPIISKLPKDSWNGDNKKVSAEIPVSFPHLKRRAICNSCEIISAKLQIIKKNVLYMNKTEEKLDYHTFLVEPYK